MLIRVFKHNHRRGCIAAAMALLGGCAHEPAPKARCHGPWVWVNGSPGLADGPPAAGSPAGGTPKNPEEASKGADGPRGPSQPRLENVPSAGHAPAQPAAGGQP
jgi:hypothetical protein